MEYCTIGNSWIRCWASLHYTPGLEEEQPVLVQLDPPWLLPGEEQQHNGEPGGPQPQRVVPHPVHGWPGGRHEERVCQKRCCHEH